MLPKKYTPILCLW